ncbi:MAG: heme exporter protein CcmB [Actinomycetota bacterium]|jgi:heme exporter protein B|nr:heme exporter protein CcmB [Actinomycetota bacterium]
MWRDALLVAGKDLRIEARSKVAIGQVAPFAVMALFLFAFALGPDRGPMSEGAPGLFWVAVLFTTVLAIQRSVSVESADEARDGLRVSGLDPAGVFLGKTVSIAAQLLVLEAILVGGIVVLYGARVHSIGLVLGACALGTVGLAASGTLYGALSAGIRVRETLLPFLFLPLVAPILLSGTKVFQAAMAGGTPSQAAPWLRLLLAFDVIYVALGVIIYGPIQESS